MENVVLVIHLMICIGVVFLVLMQRSEGGALGIGGGGGALMSGRGAADLIVKITAGVGVVFFVTSIALTMLGGTHRDRESVVDRMAAPAGQTAPLEAPPPPSGSILGDSSGLQRAAPVDAGAVAPDASAPATTTGPAGSAPAPRPAAPVGAAPSGAAGAAPSAPPVGAAPTAAPPAASQPESPQPSAPPRPSTGPEL